MSFNRLRNDFLGFDLNPLSFFVSFSIESSFSTINKFLKFEEKMK